MQETSRWAPHVTVATVIADNDHRFLLVRETKGGRQVLNQPAGHLEPGESLVEAAARECREETGRDVTLTGLVGIHQWSAPDGTAFLRFTFAGQLQDKAACHPLDPAIDGCDWFTLDHLRQADNLRSPLVLRCIEDWLQRPPYPLSVLDFVS